jgi:hypothetical protein
LIAFIEEDGPLEVATLGGWMIAAAYLLLPGRRPRLTACHLRCSGFAMGMRENGLPPDLVPQAGAVGLLSAWAGEPDLPHRGGTGGGRARANLPAREFFQRRGWVAADTGMFILAMVVLVVA